MATTSLAPAPAGPIHSPKQVVHAFAEHHIPVYGATWTFPNDDAVNDAGTPDMNDPLAVDVEIFSGVTEAARVQHDDNAPEAALQKEEGAALSQALGGGSCAERTLRVGNVVASYCTGSKPPARRELARLRAAMVALAAMPSLPPLTRSLPLAAVQGDIAKTVSADSTFTFAGFGWGCSPTYSSYASTNGSSYSDLASPSCSPRGDNSLEIGFDLPGGDGGNTKNRQPLEVLADQPPRFVGTTRSRLLIYSFVGTGHKAALSGSLPIGRGVRFAGTPWSCAARRGPATITCFRESRGRAIPPLVVLRAGRRAAYVESAIAPVSPGDGIYDFAH